MSESSSVWAKDMEELVRKSVEANKTFISEGSKFIRQLGSTSGNRNETVAIQTDLLKEAFNTMVKLNIQYTSQLVDLGIELTKRLVSGQDKASEPSMETQDREDTTQPAFILNASSARGTTALAQFILDSNKSEPMICNLVHTEFVHQQDFSIKPGFKTIFLPQSFQLNPSESQKVVIQIKIPAKAIPGVYLSQLQVKGFEEAFFSLYLQVT